MQEQFNRAAGMSYLRFLQRVHQAFLFDWYLEIGCRTGRSFRNVRGNTIAVDPYFRIVDNVIGDKVRLHIFQEPSDDFFASMFLAHNGIELSFSFLDGMHLFEFLLRDIINTEKHSHPDAVIAIHDCCPANLEMTTRDLDNLPQGAWTGDVWKLIPILQEYRPDIEMTVLDCAPTGLVVLSNLDPENQTLERCYEQITKEYLPVNILDFGVERFFDLFTFSSGQTIVQQGLPMFQAIHDGSARIRIPKRITP